jgi:hypothetical protein
VDEEREPLKPRDDDWIDSDGRFEDDWDRRSSSDLERERDTAASRSDVDE